MSITDSEVNIFSESEEVDVDLIVGELSARICNMAVPKDKCMLPGGQLVPSGERIHSFLSVNSYYKWLVSDLAAI